MGMIGWMVMLVTSSTSTRSECGSTLARPIYCSCFMLLHVASCCFMLLHVASCCFIPLQRGIFDLLQNHLPKDFEILWNTLNIPQPNMAKFHDPELKLHGSISQRNPSENPKVVNTWNLWVVKNPICEKWCWYIYLTGWFLRQMLGFIFQHHGLHMGMVKTSTFSAFCW